MMIQDVISKRLQEVKPDLIGLGGLCSDYAFLKDAIGVIRQTYLSPNSPNHPQIAPDTPIQTYPPLQPLIVLGGQIVTNDAEFIFNNLKPDYAIIGEGETAIVGLANVLRNGVGTEPFIIKASTPDINSLPFPDYEPFGIQDMIDNHSQSTRLTYRYCRPDARPYNIVASRSCPFSCTFCIHGHDRPPYRARSIESVMEEIRISYEKYQFNILILLDELFATNKKRMVSFCEGVLEGQEKYGWDFNWMFQTHANARFDLESLKLARKAGCFLFSYGVESASQTVLDSMNKKTKVSQIADAIKMAEEAGVGFSGNIIFGDIAETEQTIAESLSFWLEHCRRSFVFLSKVNPFPGSKLFDVCRERGLFADKVDYYEHINDFKVNMTNIPTGQYAALMGLIGHMETEWLFVKLATNVKLEVEPAGDTPIERLYGGAYIKIQATCPYCEETSVYREHFINPGDTFMLGTGCTKCNRKIKLLVG